MHLACPHCHNPIEIVTALGREEILCPSCGSTFQLETESTASWRSLTGRQLGRFELIESVGVGAFGSVYKARDPQLDRIVAIKIPRAGNLAEKEDLDRFLREGRSAAQLTHPTIVPVHEVGLTDGVPYLVSEFIEGPSLSDVLTAHHLAPRESAELIATVADALHYAHERGVIHRDVKPSNILFDVAGKPHLADFGLAKRDAGEITMTEDGQLLGTPAYMSPEQARGEAHKVQGYSDVYSLGVVLYRLLTGELPFRGSTRMLLHQVLHDEPRAPRKLNDHVPRDLETICLKAMAKEPAGRYAAANDLAADLRRFLDGKPIQARPVSAFEQSWRWCRRRQVIAGLSAALVLVILGGLIGTSLGLAAALKARNEARKQTELTKQRLYDVQMTQVQHFWEDYNDQFFQHGLEEQLPDKHGGIDRRGFEWFYWQRKASSGHVTLNGHPTTSVVFSPDGRRLASANVGETAVKVWDASSWQETLTLKGHANIVYSVAFSPDGQRLASASHDRTVRVWDAATGQETLTLKGHADAVASVVFSPDGRRLASGSYDRTVKVWDASSWQETLTLKGHANIVQSVAFSPDSRRLASASVDAVKVWDVATGKESLNLKSRRKSGGSHAVSFSPDGRRLASGLLGMVNVWDAATGEETLTLKGHANAVQSVAFSPDSRRLASGSDDGTVKVWDMVSGEETFTLRGHVGNVRSVSFSPDGRRLASGGLDGRLNVWDSVSGQEALTLPRYWSLVDSVTFSPDGRRLAYGSMGGTLRVWDIATQQETLTFKWHDKWVTNVAFSPDGRRLAASADHTVKLWDMATGQETLTLKGHADEVKSVVFSPDGRRLASASHEVKLWDTATGQETLTLKGHADGVTSVAFSPDGQRLASASEDRTIRVWDAASGQETLTLKGHDDRVTCVAFSPDGRRLVSASGDHTVKLWDTATGQETLTLKGHNDRVTSVVFSPDGRRLASASGDGTVKLWDARPVDAEPAKLGLTSR